MAVRFLFSYIFTNQVRTVQSNISRMFVWMTVKIIHDIMGFFWWAFFLMAGGSGKWSAFRMDRLESYWQSKKVVDSVGTERWNYEEFSRVFEVKIELIMFKLMLRDLKLTVKWARKMNLLLIDWMEKDKTDLWCSERRILWFSRHEMTKTWLWLRPV